ncbi:MAG TPA: iron-containing alcohol dehydrogenase [Methanothermobacter sp.]|nr:alcohol dehydrogenase [Methanothermobacter sp. MT-2]HHW05396.1 iron-containing alcohol dehydrogenase [Methanothermobacter sp.]HOK73151.1 iron-containing alcohol dehydrogenase [Methanothermobacter sp.]HOL68783.1 iron-containing alcohol dehydrogenase [Methanothermobacter sp.]HPQ04676.1 iron-containing alcohol dehydrogenase [Methanothermobacter sp.]
MDGTNLRKFVTSELVFGDGARLLAPQYAKNLGAEKILLVTDHGIKKVGLLDEIESLLIENGLEYVTYTEVTPNPRDYEVMEGAEVFESEGCNFIIALGGGSPIDCAKGIGIVSSNKMNILEFEGVDKIPAPGPPIICIPTTAGTSADISQFAIIRDTKRKIKIAIISRTLIPDVSLIDPHTTITMDRILTASTGMDALTHAIEAYVSNASSHLTDINALDAMKLVSENLPKTLEEPENLNLRFNMMLASLEAGLAFSNASLGLIHAIAHSLGGRLDIPHGMANAILIEDVIKFNFPAAPKRYKDIAEAMGLKPRRDEVKEELISRLKTFKRRVGIDMNLKDYGIKEEDIDELARLAFNDPCIVTNPRQPTIDNIKEILKNAIRKS